MFNMGWRWEQQENEENLRSQGRWVGEHRLKLPLVVLCEVLVLLTLQSVKGALSPF